jgi:hypothetical protein
MAASELESVLVCSWASVSVYRSVWESACLLVSAYRSASESAFRLA